MRRWTATFYTVMDTDGSRWGYGATAELARASARDELVELYSDGGARPPPWGDDEDDQDDGGVRDPASARAWVDSRPVLRVAVEFDAEGAWSATTLEGRQAPARACGWTIVRGLMDMGGEDHAEAFALAEAP